LKDLQLNDNEFKATGDFVFELLEKADVTFNNYSAILQIIFAVVENLTAG
jgi:hypothetical protein